MEILLALLAAGAFFMAGLVTGAWKYINCYFRRLKCISSTLEFGISLGY